MSDLPHTLVTRPFRVQVATGIDTRDFGKSIALYPQACYCLWHFINGAVDMSHERAGKQSLVWNQLAAGRCYLTTPMQEVSFRIPRGALFRRLVFSVSDQPWRWRGSALVPLQGVQPAPEAMFGTPFPFDVPDPLQRSAAWTLEQTCAIWWRSTRKRLRASHILQGWLLDLLDHLLGDAEVDENNGWLTKLEAAAKLELARGLRVEGLSRLAGMSASHLHRRLQAVRNVSPGDFLDNLRATVATTRLAAEDGSVASAAALAGFAGADSFGRWFTRRFGCSPSAWRQRARLPPR
jgi:AraC-like DNA-binding protein